MQHHVLHTPLSRWLIALCVVATAAPTVMTSDRNGEILLLEAGTEPRHALRYDPETGAGETMVLRRASDTFTIDGEARYPSGADPRSIVTIDATAQPAGEAHAMRLDYRVIEGAVDGGTTTSRHILRMLAEQMNAMVDLRLRFTSDARAAEVSLEPIVRDDTGPMLKERLLEEGRWLRYALVPLPDEPVGLGATWQWRRPVRERGVEYQDITEYRLDKLDGNVATINVSVVRVAADQELEPEIDPEQLRNLPPKAREALRARLRLETAETVGEGTIGLDLRRPFATQLALELRSRQKVVQGPAGQQRTTDVETVTTVSLLPKSLDELRQREAEDTPGR